ncbi:hypothetical protein ACN06F_09155 [Vreelandella sp. 21]|uniref:hypothetical protein n=1 Tax=Vreelandella sp. 21 TaxID=3402864 RepID=UPI003D9A9D57
MLKPDKGLFRHGWFWVFVLGPLFIAIVLAGFFGLFNLDFSRSLDGVDTFYERGKFFLAIAALSIPLGATFARMHASEQTAELINAANERRKKDEVNDLLKNYIAYLEEYHGKTFGKKSRFIFKSEDINHPVKCFHYFIGKKRDDYLKNGFLDNNLFDEAQKLFSQPFTSGNGLKALAKRQEMFLKIAGWLSEESYMSGLLCDLGFKSYPSKEIGFYNIIFYSELPVNSHLDARDQVKALEIVSEGLAKIASCYYYGSQVFVLYDDEYAENLAVMVDKITLVSNFLFSVASRSTRSMHTRNKEELEEFFSNFSSYPFENQNIASMWFSGGTIGSA